MVAAAIPDRCRGAAVTAAVVVGVIDNPIPSPMHTYSGPRSAYDESGWTKNSPPTPTVDKV